jgi:hypothetical protein
MAVYFDNDGMHLLWEPPPPGDGFLVLYAEVVGSRYARPEFFTRMVDMNELQDGIEVPPAGVLVF